jgi:tetratricopeptide (TPR) repeat protein
MNAPAKLLAVSAEHPFPGLRPFAYDDNQYFFGREDQIYALYRLLDRYCFVTVVGSSGSGKSSLVRAGLLPLLDTETREAGGRNWLWREMRPGDEPLPRLIEQLAKLSTDDDPVVASGRRERIAAQLHRSSFGILEALADANGVNDRSVVLVIDQFEELFRFATASSGLLGFSVEDARVREEATQFVQLLLEASRAQSNKIRIVLTMRSDFIGDCARFHGLPEAVCSAQFLVPSLTRDQLDEVIRKPVEKAGATIDPGLVERLLNDCGTEMDQLPVLQHCLSRLWEEAGKTTAADAAVPGDIIDGRGAGVAKETIRHLSLNHYRNIGGFAEALSIHADEILKDVPGPALQLAVEQIFGALSELDKEGRAIRRALRFQRLVAETGVDESTVRRVLDRFRAEDCSFLTPPTFEVKQLGETTRVDVGHEALLRRWEKVSGRGADPGWLRVEQQAGERYRGLLAIADGDNATLPSHLVDERLAWWKARPRTAAWAERYGGGFERVQRLLQVSQRRQRAKRWTVAAAFLVVAVTAGVMAWLYVAATHAQAEADARRREALKATQTSIGRLAGYLNDGTLRAVGAQKFLDDAKVTLDQAGAEHRSPETSEIEIGLLLAVSDVKDALGDSKAAYDLAENAEKLSQIFVERYPDSPRFKHLLYASKFRVGDQLAAKIHDEESVKKAEAEYLTAADIARELATKYPENQSFQNELTVVLNKVGDIQKSRKDWKAAMDRYQAALEIATAIVGKYPVGIATQKNRIAQVLSERNQPGDRALALANYREGIALLTEQLNKAPENATLISNIALAHRRIGGMLKEKPEEAQVEYEAAVAGREQLYATDPGNTAWRSGLIMDYTLLADTLMQKEDWQGALENYDAAIRIVEGLALRNSSDVALQKSLATLNVKRADALVRRGNEVLDRPPEPVVDQASRLIDEALQRYQSAADAVGKMTSGPNPDTALLAILFNVRIKIGDVLVRKNRYRDALDAYQLAATAIGEAAPTQHVVDWQIRLSVALEQAADFLASGAGADPSTYQLASSAAGDALLYYQKAIEPIEAGVSKDPDNPTLKSRKAAISTKIEAQKSVVH